MTRQMPFWEGTNGARTTFGIYCNHRVNPIEIGRDSATYGVFCFLHHHVLPPSYIHTVEPHFRRGGARLGPAGPRNQIDGLLPKPLFSFLVTKDRLHSPMRLDIVAMIDFDLRFLPGEHCKLQTGNHSTSYKLLKIPPFDDLLPTRTPPAHRSSQKIPPPSRDHDDEKDTSALLMALVLPRSIILLEYWDIMSC